jgi:hypothetical protein
MVDIITRSSKTTPLTDNEMDSNFSNLNNELSIKFNTADFTATNIKNVLNGGGGGGLNANTLNSYIQANANTANTIPLRDNTGTFYANINGNFTGNVTINSGSIASLTTPLSVANGGTGANTAPNARTSLGLVIGTNVQAYSPNLNTLSNQTTTGLMVRTGSGTYATRNLVAGTGITLSNTNGVAGDITITGTNPNNQTLNTSDNVRFNSIGIGQNPTNNAGELIATSITETSAERYKYNIQPIEGNYITLINSLVPVTFKWKDGGSEDVGFIAEAMNKVLPEVVSENNGICYGIQYSKLTVHLVKAIQELSKEIESLKEKLNGKL